MSLKNGEISISSALIDKESPNIIITNCDDRSISKLSLIKKINVKRYKKFYIFFLTINVSLSYLFIGFNIGVTDTLHENFIYLFNWSKEDSKYYLSFLSSILAIGALLGALFISPYLLKKGRRLSILFGNILGLLGIGLLNIVNIYCMLAARFIIGITIGIYTTCVGIYVKEYVPYDMIGLCGSIYELNFSIGIFFSYILGLNLPEYHSPEDLSGIDKGENLDSNWWRFMLSIPALFLIISNVLFFTIFKNETPFYIYQFKKDFKMSHNALKEIYYLDNHIEKILEDYESYSENQKDNISFMNLFSRKYRKRFFVAILLLITQQACGIDGFLMYSDSLFMQSINNKKQATLLTNYCGFFLILSGITTMLIIERFGRKKVLLIGQIIMVICLLFLAYFYYVDNFEPIIYLIIGFIYTNGVSLSPISFIYSADVLPDIGMGVGIGINNVFSFLVTQFFMHLFTSPIGKHGLMLIFAGFIIINLINTIFFLEETKNLSADEINEIYSPKISKNDI